MDELKSKYKSIIEDLQKEIPENMNKQDIPGLAVALVTKEGPVWLGCFGYTDFSKTRAVDTDTLFCLQSTTKTVTTVAFLLAVQGGLVNLDDPLVEYYPEFYVNSRVDNNEYTKITFRHLLSHTSGLTRESRVGGVFNCVPCTWEEHIQKISGSWLKFPVGKGFSYSNAGMDLIVYSLECITGEKYPEYVQRVLGDPLSIRFHYDTKEMYTASNSVKGHLGGHRAAQVDPVGLGCGAAHLSITDQTAFVQFLLNQGMANGRQVLKEEYIHAMRSTDKERWYGLGTCVDRNYGISIPYHPGGGFGLLSEMYWVPEYNSGVCAFTNQEFNPSESYIGILAKKALERMLEVHGVSIKSNVFPFQDAPAQKIDALLLERLTGVYRGAWDSTTIRLDNGVLYLEYGGSHKLIPHNETAFSVTSPKLLKGVIFQLDKGKPASLKMYSTNNGIVHMDYKGRPPESPGPNKKEWEKVTGLYQMILYGTEPIHCAVKVEGDGYLHVRWERSQRLYPYEDTPDIFFMFNGEAVIFEEDHLLYDNVTWKKIDNPVNTLTELCESLGYDLPEWEFDVAADQLTYLGRNDEAKEIQELKKKDVGH
jgi:CubicO group peptidase (beta-lactamase class C family)